MPTLPSGQRVDDPPKKNQRYRYRLALMLRKYPIQVALALALLVVAIPVYMLISSNGELRKSNRKLRESGASTQTALILTQQQRKTTTVTFCKVINTNAAALNVQSRYIQGLIVGGVKSSKAFERLFRNLGLPPYRERLRLAVKQANGLKKLELRPLKCKRLAKEVQDQIDAIVGDTPDPKVIDRLKDLLH